MGKIEASVENDSILIFGLFFFNPRLDCAVLAGCPSSHSDTDFWRLVPLVAVFRGGVACVLVCCGEVHGRGDTLA